MSYDFENYEIEPFCRHWADPADCEKVCATCGHGCMQHEVGDETACMERDCDCKQWIDSTPTKETICA